MFRHFDVRFRRLSFFGIKVEQFNIGVFLGAENFLHQTAFDHNYDSCHSVHLRSAPLVGQAVKPAHLQSVFS